jgi:hypothetical protein
MGRYEYPNPEISGVKPIKDIALANPRSRELLNDIRVDAMDHLRSAIAQAEEGRWEDAMVSSDIAHDRLLFADQVQVELDMYK